MALCVDHFVALFKWTLFNPIPNLAYVVYSLQHGIAISPALGCFASLVCLSWLLIWSSDWWYNRTYLAPIQSRDQWKQQVVIITGGASGMGAFMSQKLAALATTVIILDIQKPSLPQDPPNVYSYLCDVSSSEEVAQIGQLIRQRHGDPTILINNAGISNSAAILSLSPDQVTRLINVNLTCQFWMLQQFLPGMIRHVKQHSRPCHIISIASVMGHAGVSQLADYSASKHGVVGLHKSLRYELDYYYQCPQIRTILVVLGHVNTQLFAHVKFNSVAKFLTPSLQPEMVADRVIQAIQRRHGGTIALPWYANWTEALALLPSWAVDFFQWISDANGSVDSIKTKA